MRFRQEVVNIAKTENDKVAEQGSNVVNFGS